MSRLKTTFLALHEQNKKALIPYITAGDPSLKSTVPVMHALVEAGADVIELGMPFSDPMAEGPVIQLAHERALANGTTMQKIFSMVQEFRQKDITTPVVLMGYLNPIETIGYATFARGAANAGVDGVLIVDMPPEEGEALTEILQKQQMDSIYLTSPTTTIERLALIKKLGSGYHYYVSLKGVTGSSELDTDAVLTHLNQLKQHLQLPICVGFGISDAKTAKIIGTLADGVVIGSALIATMQEAGVDEVKLLSNVKEFIHKIRVAL
jgi:tryptophan synthase alpha chain